MILFWKATAAALIAAILGLTLGELRKDMGILLTLAVCVLVGSIAVSFLEPVLDFLWELKNLSSLQSSALEILLKGLGIGLVAEIVGMICSDAGKSSMAKTIQMLGSAVILYLSLPVFRSVISLLQQILGEL